MSARFLLPQVIDDLLLLSVRNYLISSSQGVISRPVTNRRLPTSGLSLRATGGSIVRRINRRQVRRKECNVCVCVYVCLISYMSV